MHLQSMLEMVDETGSSWINLSYREFLNLGAALKKAQALLLM